MNTAEQGNLSFVLRIWLEDNEPFQWTGHVTRIMSEDDLHFRDLDTLINYLQQHITTIIKG